MRHIIAKFGDRYLLWSENSDRPITSLMTLSELRQFTMLEDGYEGIKELPKRLERVERFGTSSGLGTTVQDLLANNSAGSKQGRVATEAGIVALYGGETVTHWEQATPLDLTRPLELYDYTGFDPVRLPVVEVVGTQADAAFVLVSLPGEPERYPVLVRVSTGDILSKGFKYLYARNVEQAVS